MMKKRIGACLLAAVLAVPCTAPAVYASAAKQEAAQPVREDAAERETLNITRKTYQEEFKTEDGQVYKEISYEYPVAEGSSDAAKAFNKFYKNLRTKWIAAAKEDLEEAKEAVLATESDAHYADEVTCEITSSDDKYICVLQSGYAYSMGAHGTPYRFSYIFDASTGKKVSAASILGMTKAQLNKKVRSLYLKKFDKTEVFYLNRKDVENALEKMDFNQNLSYLKNGKMRFYADPYVLGPYAAGFIEVAIKL